MRKLINKIAAATALSLLLSCSVAYAETQTDTFSYNNKIATATLAVKWSVKSYDKGKARTEWEKDKTYKVTAYLEGTKKNGTILGSGFDSGFTWAEVNKSIKSIWRYNSTHTIAHKDHVYDALSMTNFSDW